MTHPNNGETSRKHGRKDEHMFGSHACIVYHLWTVSPLFGAGVENLPEETQLSDVDSSLKTPAATAFPWWSPPIALKVEGRVVVESDAENGQRALKRRSARSSHHASMRMTRGGERVATAR